MDAMPLPLPSLDDWAERFAGTLHAQRARVREFLGAQQARLEQAETQLSEQLQLLRDALSHETQQSQLTRREIDHRQAELAQELASLERLREQLAARQAEWEEFSQQTADQQRSLGERLRQQQDELGQRHAEQLCELDRLRAELDHRDTAEREELLRRAEAAEARADELARRIEALSAECGRRQQEADASSAEAASQLTAIAQLRQDSERLKAESQEDEYRRRYELAMDDLKEIKARNAQLQQELARVKAEPAAAGKGAIPTAGGALNWELEKQRILAALESAGDDERSRSDRVQVQEIVARTDQLLAEKDRLLAEKECEIEELKHLLENQSGHLGAVAVGAAAFGDLIDKDEVIREHRRHLEQMQAELEQKLRQAEIEISLERAKLARERGRLDEQLRVLETSAPPASGEAASGEKPARGRWLTRLGLKGDQPS